MVDAVSHSCLERTNRRENGEAQTRSGERKQEKRRIMNAHTLVQPCGAIGSQFTHLLSGFADRLYWGAITSCLRHRALIHLTTGAALDGSYCSVAESCGVSDCKCTEKHKEVRGGHFETEQRQTSQMWCVVSLVRGTESLCPRNHRNATLCNLLLWAGRLREAKSVQCSAL